MKLTYPFKKIPARIDSPLALWLLLGIAAALRGWNLLEWSLWQDEEGSIFLSQHVFDHPFPEFFPVFFLSLHSLFQVTGISIGAGRGLATLFGIFSVWITYAFACRLTSRRIAFFAALLLAMNLGHLFWSQSIRYYTMVLVWQLLCLYGFWDGFERGRYFSLLMSNVALVLALLTHFTAIYLMPPLVLYLIYIIWSRQSGGAYCLKGYLIYGVPFLIILGFFSVRFLHVGNIFSGFSLSTSALDPIHILLTVVMYFGIPVLGLGFAAPFWGRQQPTRIIVFLLIIAIVPIVELLVVVQLRLHGCAWHYAFIALPAWAILASLFVDNLYERGQRVRASLFGWTAVCYYLAFLVAYYTVWYGDRPRWQEASHYLQQAASIEVSSDTNPPIFATVPGIVAHYLGVKAAETWTHPLVRKAPRNLPERLAKESQWYVLKASHISVQDTSSFGRQCALKARYTAQTGPADRSVLVYYCPAASVASGAE